MNQSQQPTQQTETIFWRHLHQWKNKTAEQGEIMPLYINKAFVLPHVLSGAAAHFMKTSTRKLRSNCFHFKQIFEMQLVSPRKTSSVHYSIITFWGDCWSSPHLLTLTNNFFFSYHICFLLSTQIISFIFLIFTTKRNGRNHRTILKEQVGKELSKKYIRHG